MEIVWDRRKPAVEIDDVRIVWRSPNVGELKAFEYALERAACVYRMLEEARDSFEGGRASYRDAAENVRHLIDESNAAAMELVTACMAVDQFFVPEGDPILPSHIFQGRGNEFLAFCREWVKRQGPPDEVLKNSSRVRSVKRRRAHPETVENAKGSSSMRKGSPSAPELKSTNGSPETIAPGARSS